jgi:uncharacterized membrane protein YGL010W
VLFAWLNWWIAEKLRHARLVDYGDGGVRVAWIGQFIGHKVEGRRPSFFTDLKFLLVGPMWTLHKLYKRSGWVIERRRVGQQTHQPLSNANTHPRMGGRDIALVR